jgi:hypothetical protein
MSKSFSDISNSMGSLLNNGPTQLPSLSLPNTTDNIQQQVTSVANDPNLIQQVTSAANDPNLRQQVISAANDPNLKQQVTSAANDPNLRQQVASIANDPNVKIQLNNVINNIEVILSNIKNYILNNPQISTTQLSNLQICLSDFISKYNLLTPSSTLPISNQSINSSMTKNVVQSITVIQNYLSNILINSDIQNININDIIKFESCLQSFINTLPLSNSPQSNSQPNAQPISESNTQSNNDGFKLLNYPVAIVLFLVIVLLIYRMLSKK